MPNQRGDQPQIVLHHLVDSRSERIFWALEELGLSYNVVVHQRSRFGGATKSLGEKTPSGKAPSVQLNGEWLSESAYVLHRLLALARDTRPSLASSSSSAPVSSIAPLPTSPAQQSLTSQTEASPAGIGAASAAPPSTVPASAGTGIDVELDPSDASTYYAHWAEGSLMLWMQAYLLHRLTSAQLLGGKMKIKGREPSGEVQEGMKEWGKWAAGVIYVPGVQRNIDSMEAYIKGHTYFSGTAQPGIGDFMLAYPMSTLIPSAPATASVSGSGSGSGSGAVSESGSRGGGGKKGPYKVGSGVERWMARIRERPAYQRAMYRMKAEEDAQRPAPSAKL